MHASAPTHIANTSVTGCVGSHFVKRLNIMGETVFHTGGPHTQGCDDQPVRVRTRSSVCVERFWDRLGKRNLRHLMIFKCHRLLKTKVFEQYLSKKPVTTRRNVCENLPRGIPGADIRKHDL